MNRIIRFGSILLPVAIASVVNFLTLPLVYKSLDKLEAGIWFLLIDITSIALALDFGISNVQIRKMSVNPVNTSDHSQVFRGSQKALGYIALSVSTIGTLGISIHYFISESHNTEIAISSLFFLIATAISLYSYTLVGLLRVNNRFPSMAIVSLLSNLTYLTIVYFLLRMNAKLIVLSFAYFTRSSINYWGFKILSSDIIQTFKIDGSIKYTKEHGLVFMNTVTLYLYLAIESIMLSIFYTPAIIPVYIAHRKLFDFTKSGIDAYLTSVFPDMSRRSAYRDHDRLIFFVMTTSLIYISLFFVSIPIMRYIAGPKYTLQPTLLLMIAAQFIISSGSIYVRQKNVASNLASVALFSAAVEISTKILLSAILIPILNFKAIPFVSIIGALLSIFIGLKLSNRTLNKDPTPTIE